MSSSCKEKMCVETDSGPFSFEGYLPELTVSAFMPVTRRQVRTIVQPERTKQSPSVYDQVFRCESDFNPKAHRDDRQHSKFLGLDQGKEERDRSVPHRSSSEYGRRTHPYEHYNNRSCVRIDHVKKDFYRNNGVMWQ